MCKVPSGSLLYDPQGVSGLYIGCLLLQWVLQRIGLGTDRASGLGHAVFALLIVPEATRITRSSKKGSCCRSCQLVGAHMDHDISDR